MSVAFVGHGLAVRLFPCFSSSARLRLEVTRYTPPKIRTIAAIFVALKESIPPADCDDACDKRLDVIVHSGHSGAQSFLTDNDKHVADKGCSKHDECQAADFCRMQIAPIRFHQVSRGKWQYADKGVCEHPFHDGYWRIFADKILIEHDVKGVTQLGE